MKLVLASGSIRRQEVLRKVGLKYEVVKSTVEEHSDATEPSQYVMDLSRDKANSSASQLKEKAIVIAVDTVLYMDGKIFEKPKSKEQAAQNLRDMSGNMVNVVTGMTIKDLYQDKEVVFSHKSEIYLKTLTEDDIKWYVENEKEVLNCAGICIEGKGAMFIDKIVGDFGTTYGISISMIHTKLKELGYKMSDFELA